jgi:hypothetical protein
MSIERFTANEQLKGSIMLDTQNGDSLGPQLVAMRLRRRPCCSGVLQLVFDSFHRTKSPGQELRGLYPLAPSLLDVGV